MLLLLNQFYDFQSSQHINFHNVLIIDNKHNKGKYVIFNTGIFKLTNTTTAHLTINISYRRTIPLLRALLL